MNDGVEIERDETSDDCNTMLGVSESRVDMKDEVISLRKPIKS